MIGRHPRLRFQCFLASRHANQSLCTLARELPNLSLAGYWWHNFFPDRHPSGDDERLEMLPANKQIGFFSDAYCVEWTYAKAMIVRKQLAHVLDQKIQQGQFTHAEALSVAQAILFESPQSLLGMTPREVGQISGFPFPALTASLRLACESISSAPLAPPPARCISFEINGKRLCSSADCSRARRDETMERNRISFDPKTMDAVVLSHAHIDHCGNLPNLCGRDYEGNIIALRHPRPCEHHARGFGADSNARTRRLSRKKRAKQGLPPVEPLYRAATRKKPCGSSSGSIMTDRSR